MAFVHLHLHDTYSLLDGYGLPPDVAARAKELGMIGLGQSNHGSIAGHIAHYKACKEAGIWPVLGCEFYVAKDMNTKGLTEEQEKDITLRAGNKSEASKMKSEKTKGLSERSHLLVLAMDNEGYSNLRILISMSYLSGFYRKPRIDYKTLKQFGNGLFVSTACQAGDIPRLILENKLDEAKALSQEMAAAFPNRFALEIMPLNTPEQRTINIGIHAIHNSLGIPVIATNDVHYITEDDAWIQEVMVAIGTNKAWSDPNRLKFGNGELYLRSEEEMLAAFQRFHANLPVEFVSRALQNAYDVAFRCNANPLKTIAKLPAYPIPPEYNSNADDFLKSICAIGWKRRGLTTIPQNVQSIYGARVRYELDLLKSKGFANYFLIVWDMIDWAKKHGIAVGPARGSSAGSLVAYLIGITDLDPLRFGLSFERFLSPHRNDWPDIDCDFEDARRGEVKDYLSEKYGADNVANVATFNMLKFRSAFRDASRVFGVPQVEVDKVIGYLAPDSEMDEDADLRVANEDFHRKYPNVLRAAEKLVGQLRAGGTHAAGVVLADRPLADVTAMQVHGDTPVVALTKGEAESLGLIKIDVLGLRTMSIFSRTAQYVNARRVAENLEPITISGIINSLDDPAVFAEFAAGNTDAVFQFNKSGGRRLCIETQVSCFNDLSAVNALDRPGPLDSGGAKAYVDRKKGQINPSIHPIYNEITKDTYGVLLYQEQVMRLCRELAGLDWPDVHGIRKTIAKSEGQEAVAEFWPKFRDGALRANCTEQTAEWIWGQIITHGGYSFNLSHAVAYAAIGYACMWFKLYYPKEYLCSVMEFSQTPREAVVEARRRGIRVIEPQINQSGIGYSLAEEGIVAGFDSIKGVGPEAARAILEARGSTPFTGYIDFKKRVNTRKVHKGVVKSLIEVGAFETLHPNMVALLDFHDKVIIEKDTLGLFAHEIPSEHINKKAKLSDSQAMRKIDLLPFVPRDHPALGFDDVLKTFDKLYPRRTQIAELKMAGRAKTRNEVRLITGILTDFEVRVGDMGSRKKIGLATIEDETDEIIIRIDPHRFPYEMDKLGTTGKKAIAAVVSPISEYRADTREVIDLIAVRNGSQTDSLARLQENPGKIVIPYRTGRITKPLKKATKVKSPLVIGLAVRVWEGKTKAGDLMGFVDLIDETDQQIVLIWPTSWELLKSQLEEGHIYEAKLGTTKDFTLCCDVTRGQYFRNLTAQPQQQASKPTHSVRPPLDDPPF